jgi:hypothetical protein
VPFPLAISNSGNNILGKMLRTLGRLPHREEDKKHHDCKYDQMPRLNQESHKQPLLTDPLGASRAKFSRA